MSIQSKLAARLRGVWAHDPACRPGNRVADWDQSDSYPYGHTVCSGCDMDEVAGMVEAGDFDDILGVPEPTLEDVKREAVRVFGEAVSVESDQRVAVGMHHPARDGSVWYDHVRAPTIAAAYAALRPLPDYEVKR